MESPIRILHAVSKMDGGGIENFIMNVYRNIDRTKIQFDFLDHTEENGAFDKEIILLGGRIFKLKKLSSKYFLSYQKDLKKFFKAHGGYKIIHSHLNLLSAFTLKGAQKAGIKTRIAHSHTNCLLNTGLKKMIKLYAKSQINKYATVRFACSKEAALWQFGKSADKTLIIPNAVNLETFKFSAEKRVKMRKQLCIDENTFLFGHSGGFREVKNHRFLIDVFSAIKQKNKNSKLLLIGGGELKAATEARAEAAGLSESVIFTGSVPNVFDYLCAMDAFIFPSVYEGLGISVIEAQVSGLPCFVSDKVPQEAQISGKYFTLSLTLPPQEWAKLILQTLQSLPAERQMPAAAEKYNIKTIVKMLEEFYLQESL